MSIAKRETEALRWFNSAKSDLETGELLQQHGRYSHSCFLFQQAAEKAVKALHISFDCDVGALNSEANRRFLKYKFRALPIIVPVHKFSSGS